MKCFLPFFFAVALSAQQSRLIGAWDLVSYDIRTPTGQATQPLGADPIGRISYDAAGHMTAHLMRRGVPKFAAPRREDATKDEMVAAWLGYVGYFGRYTVDEKIHTVFHQVEGAWFPNYVGTKQVRVYRFEGDRLILEADQPSGRVTVVWKRAKP